jgi:O-antigen/teichoic acid export membrane protein
MRHWFRDQHFRSLLKNSSLLAGSKAVAAVAGLATLAFAGRGLGVVMFGVLIVIHSYAQAASGLSKFQTWQLIVRYGGDALTPGPNLQFKEATGFAFALDVVSGLAGMVLAIALLPLLGQWFGIPEKYILLSMLYCTLLPTMGAATPIGVLRSLDRFDLISWQSTADPIARAILAGVAWAMSAPFEAYVAIWFVTDLGGDLYLWFLSWRELKRRDLLTGIRPTLRPRDLKSSWRFAIHVNLTGSLASAWGPIARLIIGGLLGPAAAGLYRVASSLADAAAKPADLMAKAYYPEIVRMDFRTKQPWKLMVRGTALAGIIALIMVTIAIFAGQPLLSGLFGKPFVGAYPILLILLIVPLLGIVSFPLPSMLLAVDRPDGPLKARLVGTILYFAIVAPLTWRFGVSGAAIAFVIGNIAMVMTLALQVRAVHRLVRAPAGPSSGG